MVKLRLIILSKVTNLVGGRVENPLHYSFCLSQLGITKFFTATNDFFHTHQFFRDTDKIPFTIFLCNKAFSMGQRIVQNHATLSFKVTYNLKSTWNSEDNFFFLVSPCGTSLAVYFCVCCFFWNYLSVPTFWFFYMKINCSLLTLSSPEISDPFYHKAAAAAAKSLQSCPTLWGCTESDTTQAT